VTFVMVVLIAGEVTAARTSTLVNANRKPSTPQM
jgi:hypothetical protein